MQTGEGSRDEWEYTFEFQLAVKPPELQREPGPAS